MLRRLLVSTAMLAVMLLSASPVVAQEAAADQATTEYKALRAKIKALPEGEDEATQAKAKEEMMALGPEAKAFVFAHPSHPAAPNVLGFYMRATLGENTTPETSRKLLEDLKAEATGKPAETLIASFGYYQMSMEGEEAEALKGVQGLEELIAKEPENAQIADMLGEVLAYGQLPAEPRMAAVEKLMANPNLSKSTKKTLEGFITQNKGLNTPVSFKFTDVHGKEVDTAQMKGKVILIDFWATWCGPCIAELPEVKATYAKYKDQGFEIIGISCDNSKDALVEFIAKEEMAWPQWYHEGEDGKGGWHPEAIKWGVMGIPTMFLIDKNGILRTTEARQNMEEMIPKLLAEPMKG